LADRSPQDAIEQQGSAAEQAAASLLVLVDRLDDGASRGQQRCGLVLTRR
jgi:hypothetical protein